jgi:hypothetical protein
MSPLNLIYLGGEGKTVEEKVYLKVTPLETLKDDYAQNTSEH